MNYTFDILLQNIFKTYHIGVQKIDALKTINLCIPQGSICSIIGKSGAGKSTLLHIIGTLDKPTSGKLFIGSTDVSSMSDHKVSLFRNQTIGFVFQMNSLLSEFSALENVMLPGLISGSPKKTVKERANDVLNSVGLSHRLNHRPSELSGGEQQRVAIARAILMSPPILLADEPTGNLDQKTSKGIQDLLLELCDTHKMTFIMVTHDLQLASRLPKRILMEDGFILEADL